MHKDANDLRNFIEWARTQRIKRIKVSKGTTEVEFSDLAYIDGLETASLTAPKEETTSSKTLVDTLQVSSDEEDEDLYYSVR